ncbi:MAG: cellulose-binding protein [Cyanothece sp. SIO1E1]|nr:cellulose-binding protein [Cyanothece sp. SIO1E1]
MKSADNFNRSFDKELSLGTNLTSIKDWSTEIPFVDAFKSARSWITQCLPEETGCSGSWGTDEYDKLNLDEQGWVKSLPAPEDSPEYTRVATLLFRDVEHYPGGQYIVLYDGEGTIEYGFDAQKDESESVLGRDVINVNPSNRGIYLIITSTDPNRAGDYIRNIHVIKAEYETSYESEIFNPDFIERIKEFQALRFMDWMGTNNSMQSEWRDRPKVDDASYAWKGAPVEIMVELANRIGANPWFNMPHMATDEYVSEFSQRVQDSLNPDLTAYVEYSNEVWNAQFKQFSWVRDHGLFPGGTTPYQSYGVRTAQICDIWKGAFSQPDHRVKCIMGTHTANPWVAGQVLNCDKWSQSPCYEHGIDALAITGYFSGKLGKAKNQSAIESWIDDPNINEFEKAITQLKDGSSLGPGDHVEAMASYFNEYAQIARERGLELVAYEGGSHVVGTGGVENNEKMTEFFIELHRQPEFYDLYTKMLTAWQQDPTGTRTVFMHFSDIGKPSKWGSWGALEHVDQANSPRYDALLDFIARNS